MTENNDTLFDMVSDIPKKLRDIIDSDNVALREDIKKIGSKLKSEIDTDRLSMDDYIKNYDKAIELAKMDSKGEDKSFPFTNSSKVMMPYLVEAAVDFNARSSPDIIGTNSPCKVTSYDTDRGNRVAKCINALCTTHIKNWRTDTDKQLIVLPIVGTVFKKTWPDEKTKEIKSRIIWADKLIFDHSVNEFDEAPRHSFEYQVTKNDLITNIRSKNFVNLDEKDFHERDEDSYTFIESHCWLDLDKDQYDEPYIVTMCKETETIVSIVPRFDEEDVEYDTQVIKIDEAKFFTQTIFIPDPFGTCMGLGFGILLSDIYQSINANVRQLLDAGTLQNTGQNSGFIRSGSLSGPRQRNRSRKGTVKLEMGTFTNIESHGHSPLSNDIVNFPFQGPSQTLYQLLEALKMDTKNFTNKVVEPNPNEAAELYLSRLQQEMKRPTSIMMRVFNGVSKEFELIYDLIRLYMSNEEYQVIISNKNATIDEDFAEEVNITTTADPSQGSEQERQARAQLILTKAQEIPQVINLRASAVNWLVSLKLSEEDAIALAPAPDPKATDPQEEMQKAYLEIEKLKTQAELTRAQNQTQETKLKTFEAAFKSIKTEAEIEEIVSKTMKNFAEAGTVEQSAVDQGVAQSRETLDKLEQADDNKGTTG